MSIVTAFEAYTACLGWHFSQKSIKDPRLDCSSMSYSAALSHIPGIRVIVGIWRVGNHGSYLIGEKTPRSTRRIAFGNVVRGAFEIFSPASRTALLVGDVAMTILRFYVVLEGEE